MLYCYQTANLQFPYCFFVQLYPDFAESSPFLIEQLNSYFLGGMDDMVVWTQNIWRHTLHMLEQGTQ